MKLIIAGSTGYVGTELVRQALAHPAFTSVLALGRRETPIPPNLSSGVDQSKLKSVVVDDFENYSDDAKKQLAGADACIWTIALTPGKYRSVPPDQGAKICRDYAAYGIETMSNLPRAEGSKPFRFVYFSGSGSERDPAKKPLIMGEYFVLRGDAENRILGYAQKNPGKVEACIAKPGMILSPEKHGVLIHAAIGLGSMVLGFGKIDVRVLVAGLLGQVVDGFEKDTLAPADLERLGKERWEKTKAGGN
ncbi:NAD(P)-binding Rossmann-fold containing protein [Podospora fimiseda]|uniref:NAD(P)-binding Rossmann-fold containing protein n=1 Tax=Podospora fimiseda TaxID=252190 RepID=A0AAN7BRD6_9PEZI|nr:NAD(P)-binding Rossmann-fold containing protein [Podospora fimiseda]